MRIVVASLCAVVFLVSSSVRAEAQTVPVAEVSVGYAYLYDLQDDISIPAGWYGDVNVALTDWVGIAAEASGGYKTDDSFGIPVDLSVHTFMAGPRFTSRNNAARPFLHVLIGVGRVAAGVSGFTVSSTEFAFQIGGGVDLQMSDRVGLRLGVDSRRIFSEEFEDARQIRFNVGVTFALGER